MFKLSLEEVEKAVPVAALVLFPLPYVAGALLLSLAIVSGKRVVRGIAVAAGVLGFWYSAAWFVGAAVLTLMLSRGVLRRYVLYVAPAMLLSAAVFFKQLYGETLVSLVEAWARSGELNLGVAYALSLPLAYYPVSRRAPLLENGPHVPYVLLFMLFLVIAAGFLAWGQEAVAERLAELAYYCLVAGVGLALVMVVREERSGGSREEGR